MNQDKEKKAKDKELHTGNLDYEYCAKHNMKYPKGAVCPKCKKSRITK